VHHAVGSVVTQEESERLDLLPVNRLFIHDTYAARFSGVIFATLRFSAFLAIHKS